MVGVGNVLFYHVQYRYRGQTMVGVGNVLFYHVQYRYGG